MNGLFFSFQVRFSLKSGLSERELEIEHLDRIFTPYLPRDQFWNVFFFDSHIIYLAPRKNHLRLWLEMTLRLKNVVPDTHFSQALAIRS